MTSEPSFLDAHLPAFDALERHACTVRAAPERVFSALRTADLAGSPAARLLLAARGFHASRSFSLDAFERAGFVLLDERPPRELALGVAGRFWTPSGCIQRLDLRTFAAFGEAGSAKAVWGFTVEPLGPDLSRLSTETRVACYGEGARRRFRLYWAVVRPFSGFLRRRMLAVVKRAAET
ncbi:MAG: hypothetical protein ABR599_09090 [Gemmatimonadota bacterium]